MRILANENFAGEAVVALRARGHDVLWVRTDCPGSTDSQVADRARSEARLLLTFDKDPAHVARVAVAVLEAREDWGGHFSVIEDWRIRMTPLPTGPV